jgi:hypothetical protein
MCFDNFRYNIALRWEQKNVKGGKMYVDYKIEYSEVVSSSKMRVPMSIYVH